MAIVCPAILAPDKQTYRGQIDKIIHVAHRIQIDLTDGVFAPSKTIDATDAWWPVGFKADFHLMYQNPLPAINQILIHNPNLVIIHAEAEGEFDAVLRLCKERGAKLGVALLPQTAEQAILPSIDGIDHVLIFSGDLGRFGGNADMGLLSKVQKLKSHKPELEIGWDGGITDQNIAELVLGGVDVLNVGGFLQNADDPATSFRNLQRIAEETGTT